MPDRQDPFIERIPLDGRIERAQFPPLLSGFLVLVVAFILFQGISLVASLALIFGGGTGAEDLADIETLLDRHGGAIIVANTIGQVFGLLIPAVLVARMHSSRWKPFVRLRAADTSHLILSVIGLVALVPVVQWLGGVSDTLPWPDVVRQFEQSQLDLIEHILLQDFNLVFSISMLALTPAICEEVLFRGYLQRQAERSVGAFWGVVLSGVVFGFYHLRLTQALPLSVLGIFMAYITWRSGSLIPAMVVHLLHNGFAAVLGKLAANDVIAADSVETLGIPLYILLPAGLVLAIVVRAIHRLPVREDRLDAGGTEEPGQVTGGGTEHERAEV